MMKTVLIATGQRKEAVVDMVAVGGHDGGRVRTILRECIGRSDAAKNGTQRAPQNGQAGIDKRNTQAQNGNPHRDDEGIAAAGDQRDGGEGETDKETAGITQEDGGGIVVVAQEAEEGADKDEGEGGMNGGIHKEGRTHHANGGDNCQAGRESVQTVNEIEGVDNADVPREGERDVDPG